ncbi:MAG TPA: MerR family transcriptional regulator [Polyangiaceae bacterium]|nr:MerR family transcriptional regulator [Polyangiaceae bacterium]
MAEPPLYRIGTVAQLSGVSTHLIRIWERRYNALEPSRSGGRARLYSAADLERLRLLKLAVGRGHAIGQIAGLGGEELARLSGKPEEHLADDTIRSFIDEFLAALHSFDSDRAQAQLIRGSVLFSARALVFDVLGPLLGRIGKEWASGELCVASEHLGSTLVRDSLSDLLRRLPKDPNGQLALVTTPEGELHELGALLSAVTIALEGYRVLYLGPNSPAAEIARAARSASAAIVAVSIVSLDHERAVQAVRELLAALPEQIDFVIGGTMAESVREAVGSRALVPGTLASLEYWLRARKQG